MKRTLILGLLLAAPGLSLDKRALLRRVTLAGACAMSMMDLKTTQRAASLGAIERNPILAGRDNRPALGRIVILKLGLCGGQLMMQEKLRSNTTWTVVNSAQVFAFGYAARRNQQVIDRLMKKGGEGY